MTELEAGDCYAMVKRNVSNTDTSLDQQQAEYNQNAYQGCFQRQQEDRCGMQALNNAVGQLWVTTSDMNFACDDYLSSSRHEGLPEKRAAHESPTGWYSSEVMAHAVNTTSLRRFERVKFRLSLEPLHVNPNILHSSVGAVVNIRNRYDGIRSRACSSNLSYCPLLSLIIVIIIT